MSSSHEIKKLEEIMEHLRGENGCPWDREQTPISLKPCLLEEAYEVLEAIDEGSPEHLREELGDLLLQVVFHAQIAKERGQFTLADVIRELNEKMIRRHPHVFASTEVQGVKDVLKNWEEIKATEKEEIPVSALDGIPVTLPALMRAEKIQSKASHLGFDWDEISGPLEKVKEEAEELVEARTLYEQKNKDERLYCKMEEEFGDLLFSLVNLARFLDIRPEIALNRTVDKFYDRFRKMEANAAAHGEALEDLTLTQMDELWEESKRN